MSDKLKDFQGVIKEALFKYFASTVDSISREDIERSRSVVDTQTNNYVRTHDDEQLGDFDSDDVVLSEARETHGIVYVTFMAERGERVYTFGFTQPNTLMNIVMKEVVLA